MRVTTQTAITQKISRDIQKPVIPDAFATSPPAATPGQPKPDLHALPPSEVRAGDVPEMSTSPGERAINTSTTYGYDSVTMMQETKTTVCNVEKA